MRGLRHALMCVKGRAVRGLILDSSTSRPAATMKSELTFGVPRTHIRAIRSALRRQGSTTTSIEDRYFDTEDRRLAKAGLALRLCKADGFWEQTLKAAGDSALARSGVMVSRPDPVGAKGRPGAPRLHFHADVRAALRRALGNRVATGEDLRLVHSSVISRHIVRITSGETRLEIAFDDGVIHAGRRSEPVHELRYELKQGSAQALVRFARAGVVEHGVWLSMISKEIRGDRLSRGAGGASPTSARPARLHRSMSGEEIFADVIGACFDQIVANAVEIAWGSLDDEVIHQLRIGLRRVRTASRELGVLHDKPWSGSTDAACRRMFHALGEIRDRTTVAEAMQARLAAAGSPTPLLSQRGPADKSLVELVRAPEFQCALLDMLAVSFGESNDPARATAVDRRPGVGAARAVHRVDSLLEGLHHRLARDARNFTRLDPAARHGVRKRLKRLRYLAELVSPLYKSEATRRYLGRLGPAQEALGDCVDLDTALRFARAAVDKGDHAAWFNVGWLTAQIPSSVERCPKRLRAAARAKPFWH